MQNTITVTVTQEDIDTGVRRNSCQCPVAKAIRRGLGDKWEGEVSVGVNNVILQESGKYYHDVLPLAVQDFITGFDLGNRGYIGSLNFTIQPRRYGSD